MSEEGDRRRRRANGSVSGSEDDEAAQAKPGSPEANGTTPSQNEDPSDHDDDYASAAEDSLLSSEEDDGEDVTDDDEDGGSEEDAVTGDAVRESGDGQEEAKVDDDEDRRNPQYIPKRGNFYEHDDREDEEEGKEGEEGGAAAAEVEAGRKPRVWRSDAAEKWGHDKFLELEQQPKSKDELVNAYGYDIRNEDNAPRARRRRRYGRGPNKYTRNWEDVEAYGPQGKEERKERGAPGGPKGPRKDRKREEDEEEDFPALQPANEERPKERKEMPASRSKSNREAPLQRRENYEDNNGSGGSGRRYDNRQQPPASTNRQREPDNRRSQAPRGGGGSGGRGGGRGFAMREGGRGGGRDGGNRSGGRGPPAPFPSNRRDHQDAKLDRMMGDMDIRDNRSHHRGNVVSPTEGGKPKRYSTQRGPRGSANGTSDRQMNDKGGKGGYSRHHHNNEDYRYNGSANAATTAASGYIFPSSGPSGPPPSAPFHQQQVDAAAQLAAVAAAASAAPAPYGMFTPAANAGPQYHAPVTVAPLMTVGQHGDLATVLAATHHMQAPAEQLMLGAAAAAAHAGTQGYAEVRGGVTYFNAPPPAQVSSMQRAPALSKRPKAAIPIVDPKQMAPPGVDHHDMSNGGH